MSDENGKPDEGAFPSLLDRDTAPGLARVAVGAWWRTSPWAAQAAARGTRRLADAARLGRIRCGAGRRHAARGRDRRPAAAPHQRVEVRGAPRPRCRGLQDEPLRERWDDLVDLSTEMEVEVDGHPAFAGILRELHPDEARILRLLYTAGPQAAVDVRNWRPLGIGSHVVAPGLNMIGQHAGCLMVDRVPVYLSNLFRLGLIWFSRDPVGEIGPYQVLEAQPEVRQALKSASHGTTVRRSVRLTPFGDQFCLACPPADTREFEAVGAPKTRAIDEVPPPTEEPEPGVG